MSDNVLWRVNPEITTEHWLKVDDGEGWWSAFVKWDGCLEITRYFNLPWGDESLPESERDASTLHLCSIDDAIQRLELLRDMARRHFGAEWPK
jgi:hypothetical protein